MHLASDNMHLASDNMHLAPDNMHLAPDSMHLVPGNYSQAERSRSLAVVAGSEIYFCRKRDVISSSYFFGSLYIFFSSEIELPMSDTLSLSVTSA